MADGWKRLPGAARNYINEQTGQVLSRRQYDAARSARGEIKRMTGERLQIQKAAQNRYNSIIRDYQAKQRAAGREISKQNARTSKELKNLFKKSKSATRKVSEARKGLKESQTDRDFRRYDKLSKAANRELRGLLEDMGRREGIPKWIPVGFSDKFRKGKITSRADLPPRWRK